ncbi:CheB methylesterase domain-containing protein [Virgibacillus sp. 179-BFC.A HS]|uniref:protein-glutamate methylesterase n=1 Tax=Tigheibacillus jepli TaxID=3035914 RepID=A0ABU5CHS7_9BACI|nr:CheB methylesterase domain-containing protein [Virgibacillus sp. 179-BFC.A HS]MDY0405870.1 CheB methylesterase domain-containing protein [Virgibacillus sp. 179-BFC.A HS]
MEVHENVDIQEKAVTHLIAIGSSTGGPKALQQVLSDLPKHFETPILIVQHMPAGFTKMLAQRLNMVTDCFVKEAEQGEQIKKRTVYIAPAGFHMKLEKQQTGYTISLTQLPPVNGHRPSVNVMLKSLANLDLAIVAVILTGMGNDGTEGIKMLKSKQPSAVIIAEAQETAVVYGMPKSAAATNLVDYMLPLHQIGEKVKKIASLGGN